MTAKELIYLLSIVQQTGGETVGLTPQDTICTLTETLGSIDTLIYRIYPDSRAYGKAQSRVSQVWGIDKQLSEEPFRGRVSRIEGKSSGITYQTITAESAAARLKDGIVAVNVRRTELLNSALARILQAHNNITDEASHVYLGTYPMTIVEVTQSFDYVTTYEAIETVCADAGLEWRISYNSITNHYLLDVSELFGTLSQTVICVGKNLGSIRYSTVPSQLATRLIPLGGIGYDGTRLTIQSYHGRNSIYIDRDDLIAEHGIICRKAVYDDIVEDDPRYYSARVDELYSRGLADAQTLSEPSVSWEISAIDLARAGYNVDTFRVGDFYHIMHPILGADVVLRLVGKKTDYRNPQRSSLTFGDKAATLSSTLSSQAQTAARQQTAQTINVTQIIENRMDGIRLIELTEDAYNALQYKQADTLYVATTGSDFTLYLGDLPLRMGGGITNNPAAALRGSNMPSATILAHATLEE